MPIELTEEDKVIAKFLDSKLHDEVEKDCLSSLDGTATGLTGIDHVLFCHRSAVTVFVHQNSPFDDANSREIAETMIRDVFDCAFDE